MKIIKLAIYGFGRHEDRIITLDPELTVFWGANEAGKTTLQQFIVQTLFGYPVRGGNFQRYEPKKGGKFGGQIHIDDEQFGRVIIERIDGKSAGNVTVYFSDGSTGGERELQQILRGLDRSAFEAVFAFSVHQLQGLERMTEEELSRTLLASGTTGVDSALKVKDRLDKDMAELFKKNGRNPEMNRLLEELRTMDKELKELRAQADLFAPSKNRIREIDEQLRLLETEEQKAGQELKALTAYQQAVPLKQQQRELKEQLAVLPEHEFPAEGQRRMERFIERAGEEEAKASVLRSRLAAFAKPEPVENLEELDALIGREPDWHRLRTQLSHKQEELDKLSEEKERLLTLIGMPEQAALACDASLQREEELHQLLQELTLEEEEQRFNERQLEQDKMTLSEMEAELDRLMRNEPDEEMRSEAEEWQKASADLAEARAAQNMKAAAAVSPVMMLYGLGAAAAVMAWVSELSLLYAAAVLFFGSAAVLSMKEKRGLPEKYDAILRKYEGREAELDGKVRAIEDFDRKVLSLTETCDELARKLEAAILRKPVYTAARRFQSWLAERGFPADMSPQTTVSLFDKVRAIQQTDAKLKRLRTDLRVLEAEQGSYVNKAQESGVTASPDELYPKLRAERSRREHVWAEQSKRLEQKEAAERELTEVTALLLSIRSDIQALLQEGHAENVEQYYRLYQEAQKKEELLYRLAIVESQLTSIGSIVLPDNVREEDLEVQIKQREQRITACKEERNRLLAERAEKNQTVNKLLTDDAYAEKQQQFEEKKSLLSKLARQWSVDQAVAEAIRKTMEELKESRLPAVLTLAQQLFRRLTVQEYKALILNTEGCFEAVRKDDFRFRVAELSQATKEQAYLSLRLALAAAMKAEYPFPFVMDDPFVHFDRSRQQQVVNLMDEMKLDHQFLYFTCHDTVDSLLTGGCSVEVASNERSVSL